MYAEGGPMIYIALAVLAALQIADLWTTSRFKRGSEQEANPLMKMLWERFGFGAIVAGKLAVTGAVAAYALSYPAEPFAMAVVVVTVFLMIWVVGNNLMLLSRG